MRQRLLPTPRAAIPVTAVEGIKLAPEPSFLSRIGALIFNPFVEHRLAALALKLLLLPPLLDSSLLVGGHHFFSATFCIAILRASCAISSARLTSWASMSRSQAATPGGGVIGDGWRQPFVFG
jgi:hypothetical protein